MSEVDNAIEYRDHLNSRLVVVQRVNTGSYAGNSALVSIAWVPIESGTNLNATFDVMSAQFVSEGLIHKVWSSIENLNSDASFAALSAKSAWPTEWVTGSVQFIGCVLA